MLNRDEVIMHEIVNALMQPCRMKRDMNSMRANLQRRDNIGLQGIANHQ